MNNKWHQRFMKLTDEIASWSKDYKKVGCVIVDKDNKILSTGYNGMPFWFDDENLHNIQSDQKGIVITHAEINAFNTLDKEHYNKDLTLYVNKPPCINCSTLIVNSKVNIKKIIYRDLVSPLFRERYNVKESLKYLKSNGIELLEYDYKKILYDEVAILDVLLSQHELTIDYAAEYLAEIQDILTALVNHEEPDTSFYDGVQNTLLKYDYADLNEFAKNFQTTNVEEFYEWMAQNK